VMLQLNSKAGEFDHGEAMQYTWMW
jgi:hypothetical protein